MALSLPPGLCKSGTEKPFALCPTQFLGTQISGASPLSSLNRGHGFHKLRWRPLPSELKVYETRKRRNGIHTYVKAALAGAVTTEMPSKEVILPKGEMWAIHKFGGTCVGTAERLWNVAGIIVDDQSESKVVVVSAMSKVTDMLYDLVLKAQSRDTSYTAALDQVHEKHKETASNLLEGDDLDKFLSQLQSDVNNLKAMLHAIYIAGHATESFSDFVVGHGELWSAQILAATVRKRGLSCVWMDTREVLVVNPTSSNQADPDYAASEENLNKWYAHTPAKTIIATGFIASTKKKLPTTLKRDGSDFSAAIMGALFRAGRITIWTDVDGVYSADPRKVSEAVILKTLSYQEAWEMSYFGANVLHPRTIIPVMKYNIPIVIRNVFNLSSPGTNICHPCITEAKDFEPCSDSDSVVKGFATIDNVALVNVEGTGMAGVPGTASTIFGSVKDVGANVIMISQASSEHSVCFAVPEKEVGAVAVALNKRFKEALDAGRLSQVEVISDCSILAAVGQRMASTPGVCATLFNALAKANINVRAIAQGCSEYNITVVVKREDSIRALRAVHSRFYLSKTTLAVGIIGPGLIGGEQLDNVVEQVLKMVPKPLMHVAKYPTGLDLKVDEFENFEKMVLSNQQGCKVLGIVGVGGVGKTTLAKEIFNRRRSDYTKSSFLFDVRQNPITVSQTKLLEAFIGEKNCKIENGAEGLGILLKYLSSFHGLIVLDDIDDIDQLNAILPIRDILSRESLILVTSRDKHVLRSSGVLESSIYYLKGLSESHSEELFCCYALNQRFPLPDFEGLVKRFVKSCDGLPLSLKVFGALVSGQEECYWEETLDELEKILPGTEIHKSLKISYDKLSSDDQQIFLDIASFFIGEERDRAIRIWGLRGIVNLQDKCLFELDAKNKIRIHDHFRDLVRNIAQGLGIRRLWEQSTKDIDDLLEQSSREMTEARGIRMLSSYHKLQRFPPVMPKARCKSWRDGACGISNLQFVATGDGYYLEPILEKARSPNLRWLRWHNCPYSCLPSWIPMENLRVLQIVGNRFKSLWEEESRAPLQLRELYIQTLTSISNLPKSIGQLQYLEKISIFIMGPTSLKSLPEEFCELRSLKYLCLDGCSEIISLPNSFGRLTNLQHIHLSQAISLQMLPESFGALTRLKSLNLSGCFKVTLSSATLGNITTLEYLNISHCRNVTELPPQIEHQRSLKELHMKGTNFKELSDWIGNLCNLEALSIGNNSLEVLLPLSLSNLGSLKILDIFGAPRLKYLPTRFPPLSQLEKLQIGNCGIEYLPQHLKMNNLVFLTVVSCPLLELPFGKIEEERETGRELKSFHDDGKCMLALKEIDLSGTEISEVFFPSCVCPNLQSLILIECKKLTQIGGLCGLSKLKVLNIGRCVRVEELPNLEMLISLELLYAYGCKRLRSIPGLGQLKKLRSLKVWGCDEMLELSGAKHLTLLKELDARDCPKLRWGEGEVEHLRQRLKEGLYL